MSKKPLTALRLLAKHPDGLYGSEMVALSEGRLTRGTVYTLLDRMVKDGLVKEVQEPPSASLQLARTRHFITAEGKRAYAEFLSEHRDMALSYQPQSA